MGAVSHRGTIGMTDGSARPVENYAVFCNRAPAPIYVTSDMAMAEYAADRCGGVIKTGSFKPSDRHVDEIIRGYLIVLSGIEVDARVGPTTCVYVPHPPLDQAELDQMGQLTASIDFGEDWQSADICAMGYRRSALVPQAEQAASNVVARMKTGLTLREALAPIPIESVRKFTPGPPPSDEELATFKTLLLQTFLRDLEIEEARLNDDADSVAEKRLI